MSPERSSYYMDGGGVRLGERRRTEKKKKKKSKQSSISVQRKKAETKTRGPRLAAGWEDLGLAVVDKEISMF